MNVVLTVPIVNGGLACQALYVKDVFCDNKVLFYSTSL